MPPRAERRQANKGKSVTCVQVGANRIFKAPGKVNLLTAVRDAVQLNQSIIVEGQMLATLHVLRLLGDNNGHLLPALGTGTSNSQWQTMMYNCYAAVSHATGDSCQQFSAIKHPDLAETYKLYQQSLPTGHVKPIRPTWLKHVLKESSAMAQVNAGNHVSTNLLRITRQYLAWKLEQMAYVDGLAEAKQKSWTNLVLWAATTPNKTAADLLPRYTSLERPPAAVMSDIEALITTVKGKVGPLPVDENNKKKNAGDYLPWMHHILTEYEAADVAAAAVAPDVADAAKPQHPRTFSMLPQVGNRPHFIQLSNLGLHRLLAHANVTGLPSFSSADKVNGEPAFSRDADKWWRDCTGAPSFCASIKKHFQHRVSTDGYSASVTTFRAACTAPASQEKKRKRAVAADDPNQQWVCGVDAGAIKQAEQDGCLVAVDPGRRSIFTAAVHDREDLRQDLQKASPTLSQRYRSFSWSNKRWHEVSGSNEHQAKSRKWLQDAPAVHAMLLSTPTAKVADTGAFGVHIKHRLQHALAVQQHFSKPCHRKLRRKRKIRRQKALQEVCNTISLHSSKTVVAFGDAKFSSSSKGLAPTPTSSLRRHLGTTCRVCDVDEFRTSMLCCACHKAMVGMPIPGERPCYAVRLCKSSQCPRMA